MTGFYTDRQTRTVKASNSVGISRSEAEGNETEPSFERLMSDLVLSSGNLSRISTLSPEQRDRLREAVVRLSDEERRFSRLLGSSRRDTHRATEKPVVGLKGSITASCGHVLKDDERTVSVRYGSEGCDSDGFHPSVVFAEYCPACAVKAGTWPEWIANDAEEALWLSGQHPVQQAAQPATEQVGMKPEGRNENQNTFNNGDTWPPVGWRELK